MDGKALRKRAKREDPGRTMTKTEAPRQRGKVVRDVGE